MENEKQVAIVEKKEFGTVRELSKVFYEAGIFEDIKSEAMAIVKIIAGREYGLSPMESMNGLYIVKGRVVPMSNVISALVKKSEKYDYIVEKLDDTECVLSFTFEGEEIGKSSFGTKEAAKAGLINRDTYKSYPRNMFFSRAIANGCRWYCPQVFSGSVAEELLELGTTEVKPEVVTLTKEGVNNGEA